MIRLSRRHAVARFRKLDMKENGRLSAKEMFFDYRN